MKHLLLLIFATLPLCTFAQKDATVKAEQEALKNALMPFQTKQDSLVRAFRQAPESLANTQEYQLAMQQQYDKLVQQQIEACLNFAKNHKDSPVALSALTMISQQKEYLSEVDDVFQKLAPAVKNTPTGKEFGAFLRSQQATAIGATAPDFTLKDAADKPVKLSDFHGKYVLVDFWASWCGPCRQENPNVVRLFNQYKNKNFTILGVSLDEKKDAWLKAIEKDQLEWTQVAELQSWKYSTVAQLYSITAIPFSILINPQGKIVAKNLRGAGLAAKLSELFD